MLRTKSLAFVFVPAALVALGAFALVPALASAEQAPPNVVAEDAPRTTVNAAFQRYVLAPNGKPMGLLLDSGAFVRTPRHAMHRDAPQLNAGDALEVEGVEVQTPTGTLVARAVVKANGVVIADATRGEGRRHHKDHEDHAAHRREHHELQDVSSAGKVASVISGPKGRVLAVVLDDGTTATAHDLGELGLKVGDQVAVSGRGGEYAQGKALRVEKITLPDGQVRELPRHAPRAEGKENPD